MAAQNIGNLKVSIGADTKDLARGIGRAKALMGSLSRAAKITGVAAGAAFAAASAGLVAMTKGGLDAVDAQAKMARSVDGSIDGLRALQIAGSDAGVAVGQMNGAVQMMGKRLSEAAREGTGPASDALKTLGLDARALMEMDVDARFGMIADRINDMGLSAQDAAGLMREFGVRSNEVSLALLQGSGAIRAAREEVQSFGLSMSGEMAAGVEAANDAMSRIGFVFEGMRNQLAVGLAPVLQGLAVNFQDASRAGGPLQDAVSMLVSAFSDLATTILDPAFIEAATLFGVTLANAVGGLSRAMVVLSENADIAGLAMVGLGAAMAFFSGPIGLAVAAVAGGVFLLSTRLASSAQEADSAAEAEKRLQTALDLVDRSNSDAVASGELLIASHIDTARAALEAAKSELALVRARQTAGNALLDQNPLTAGGNSGYAEAMAENAAEAEAEVRAAEEQLSRYQATLEGFKRSQFPTQGTRSNAPKSETPPSEPGGSSVETLNDGLKKLIATIDPAAARVAQMEAAMALLDEAKKNGIITDDEYLLRAKQLNETFKEVPALSKSAAAGISAISKSVEKVPASEMADSISAAFKTLVANIDTGKSALKTFAIELGKIFLMKGVSKIFSPGSVILDLFGGIPGNAMGTDNWRGGLSWVGEQGPEIVNLPRGAQVIPNNKIGQMGANEPAAVRLTIGVDESGNLTPFVQSVSGRVAVQAVAAGMAAQDQKTAANVRGYLAREG